MKKEKCTPASIETEVSTAIDAINPHRWPTMPGVGVDALVAQEQAIAAASGRTSRARRLWLNAFLISGAIAGHIALATEIWRRSGK